MLASCLKWIWYTFLGSITSVICVYFIVYAASWIISILVSFFYGGGSDEEV